MYKTLPLIFAAGAMAASAQSTITTSWLAPAFDNTPVASVVGADATAVTYSIACSAEDIENDECGIPDKFTITAGPSILEYHYTNVESFSDYQIDITINAMCTIHGTTEAVCVESADGSDADSFGTTTETLTGTDMAWSPLIITAGADKLSATAGASTTGSASASATGTSSAQSGSRTSAGASSTGSSASSSSTDAASTPASHSGSASGTTSQGTAPTGGAAQFAVPVAGVAGVLVAALAL